MVFSEIRKIKIAPSMVIFKLANLCNAKGQIIVKEVWKKLTPRAVAIVFTPSWNGSGKVEPLSA